MTKSLQALRLLLLGIWLGAALFFGAAVAPAVFGVLRGANLSNANELSGSIVSKLLAILNVSGFAIAIVALVTFLIASRTRSRLAGAVEMISLAIMAIMTGISHWVISARMIGLRAAMQFPIDQIARDDPRRIEFDALHHYSVRAMGVALIAGLLAFIVAAKSDLQRVK